LPPYGGRRALSINLALEYIVSHVQIMSKDGTCEGAVL